MSRLCLGPSPLDLCVYAGDKNRFAVEITAADTPVNLAGAEITTQARLTRLDDNVAVAAEIEPVDLENGKFMISWGDVRTLLGDAAAWRGVWDLQIRFSDDLPETYLAGSFLARGDVTRSP